MDVGFLRHRQQGLLRPAARLQEPKESRCPSAPSGSRGRWSQVRCPRRARGCHSDSPCGPRSARGAPRRSAPRRLGVHQCLGEHPHALPQDVPILLFERLANERREIQLGLAIVAWPPIIFSSESQLGGTMPRSPLLCLAQRLGEFPPRPRTLGGNESVCGSPRKGG